MAPDTVARMEFDERVSTHEAAFNDSSSQTYSGLIFDFSDPRPEMISLEDIAVPLFKIERFNGHLGANWTLGHHSILVSRLMDHHELEALFHDASEAYTGDCPGPFKKLIRMAYKTFERPIERAIAQRFGLEFNQEADLSQCPWPKGIKAADILAQDIEATLFMPVSPHPKLISPGFKLERWHQTLVKDTFQMDANDFIQIAERLLEERQEMRPAQLAFR